MHRFQQWPRAYAALAVVLLAAAALAAVFRHVAEPGLDRVCSVSKTLVPKCGRYLGVVPHTDQGQTWTASVANFEQLVGRKPTMLHSYHAWNGQFPTTEETVRRRAGQLLAITWLGHRESGSTVGWKTISSGAEDGIIDTTASRIRALSRPVFLSFQNEPESHVGTDGSAQDYVRAWRHIHDRFAVAGVTNVVWLWNVIGANSGTMHALVRALYPGNAYVDWVAWDPYNWAGCRGEPWRDFAGIVKPFYDWLVGNGFGGKPFMLAEYGSVEDPANPSAKADWFSGEAKTLAKGEFPKLKAMIYFDHPAPPASCDWRISTSTASVAAYRDLATSTARD